VFLKLVNGNLNLKISKEFCAEMERITKKKPPSKTIVQMMFAGFDEYDLSVGHNKRISPVFEDLFPEQRRIYILVSQPIRPQDVVLIWQHA